MQLSSLAFLSPLVAAAVMACGLAGTPSAAQSVTFPQECMKLDLDVIGFIESRGEANDLPQQTLAEAGLKHLDARIACIAGRVEDAVILYRGVLRTVEVSARMPGDRAK